jgi:hypothetical protein
MADMEFLKAMLAEMNANQEKAEANRKAGREALKEMMDANTKTNKKEMLARRTPVQKQCKKRWTDIKRRWRPGKRT